MGLEVRKTIELAAQALESAGVPDAEHDARELYLYFKGIDRVGLMMHWTDNLQDNTVENFMKLVDRRMSREPLQHIIGKQNFMGLDFSVNPDVLIPRQDTEVVVDEAIKIIKNAPGSVLDLCTGSGVIGITIAKLVPETSVTGADISKAALKTAEKNAKANGVKVKFIESNMFSDIKGAFGNKKFNYIISNPPYISKEEMRQLEPEVKDYEPEIALFGGEDGLDFYRIIVNEAQEYLKKNGTLILEIGYEQGAALREMLESSGSFSDISILKDLGGNDRVVTARKTEKKKK